MGASLRDWWAKRRGTPDLMVDTQWGPNVTFSTLLPLREVQPDLIDWRNPVVWGLNYQQLQLRGGVADLNPCWDVETGSGGNMPYWLQQPMQNPPQSTRFGGSVARPMGPAQVEQMKRLLNSGKPLAASGPGTIYTGGQ